MTLCNATYEDLLEAQLGIFDTCPDLTCGQKVNHHRVRVAQGMLSKDTHAFHFLPFPCLTIYFPRSRSMNGRPSCFLI